jgi:hypothetical protein
MRRTQLILLVLAAVATLTATASAAAAANGPRRASAERKAPLLRKPAFDRLTGGNEAAAPP